MKPKVLFIAAGILLTVVAAACPTLHVLVLQDSHSGRTVFVRTVSPGDSFTLHYTHSVKHKPVWDFYVIDEHYKIMQHKTIFPDSDYGLPSHATGGETYTLLADGNGCISGMRRVIPSLMLRVERIYDNVFTFDETVTVNLSQELGDSVVDLRVHRIGPLPYAVQWIRMYGEHLWKTTRAPGKSS